MQSLGEASRQLEAKEEERALLAESLEASRAALAAAEAAAAESQVCGAQGM